MKGLKMDDDGLAFNFLSILKATHSYYYSWKTTFGLKCGVTSKQKYIKFSEI